MNLFKTESGQIINLKNICRITEEVIQEDENDLVGKKIIFVYFTRYRTEISKNDFEEIESNFVQNT